MFDLYIFSVYYTHLPESVKHSVWLDVQEEKEKEMTLKSEFEAETPQQAREFVLCFLIECFVTLMMYDINED